MIQVCSQCGTRWNVRDKQRSWCPRCGGTLLAPSAHTASAPQAGAGASQSAQKPAPGYRWIAVRPGAAPPARRRRTSLGPTPRYRMIPSWGLEQYFGPGEQPEPESAGPTPTAVRRLLMLTTVALAFAVFAHVVRYILLLVNRSVLLHPVIAYGGVALGLLASVLALVGVIVTAIFLANWLIVRRAAAYRRRGQQDPRSRWEILILSLIPGLNILIAPVFVVELAIVEGRTLQLRRQVVVWWVLWALSAVTALWSVTSTVLVTFFWPSPQGIADNTVITTVAYLFTLLVIVLTTRLYNSFETTEGHRSARRWVVVGAESDLSRAEPAEGSGESVRPVEPEDENPAA